MTQVLVAHGFSEHLWGRYAGLLAGVPALVHVEHNSRERYTRWRLKQALGRTWRRRPDLFLSRRPGSNEEIELLNEFLQERQS